MSVLIYLLCGFNKREKKEGKMSKVWSQDKPLVYTEESAGAASRDIL